ncbi:hypothetical protein V5799_010017 [Amblyomma americanum]|uniref:Secreted protein n=1 Tax=Amblyomma americanum TaxID=6943 RepID=A0AAQ4F999_AMBAM
MPVSSSRIFIVLQAAAAAPSMYGEWCARTALDRWFACTESLMPQLTATSSRASWCPTPWTAHFLTGCTIFNRTAAPYARPSQLRVCWNNWESCC